MTFLNRMEVQSRDNPPTEFTIRPNQVGKVASHIRQSAWMGAGKTKEEIEDLLRAGKICIRNIPIRVLGQEKK